MVDAASTTRTRQRPRTWTTVRPPSPTGRIRPLRVHRLQCDLVPGLQARQRPVSRVILRLPPGEVDEQIPLPQRLVAAGRHSRAFFRYRYAPTVLAGASHLAQICHTVVPAAHQSQRLPRPRHRHVVQPASFLAIPLVCPRVPPCRSRSRRARAHVRITASSRRASGTANTASLLLHAGRFASYSDENVEYVIEQGARMHTPDTMAATVSRPVFATC